MKFIGSTLCWLVSIALLAIAAFGANWEFTARWTNSDVESVLSPLYRNWRLASFASIALAGIVLNPLTTRLFGSLTSKIIPRILVTAVALLLGVGSYFYQNSLFQTAIENNQAMNAALLDELQTMSHPFRDAEVVGDDYSASGRSGRIQFSVRREVSIYGEGGDRVIVQLCGAARDGGERCVEAGQNLGTSADDEWLPGFVESVGVTEADVQTAHTDALGALNLLSVETASQLCSGYLPVVDHNWRVVRQAQPLPNPPGARANCGVPETYLQRIAQP